MINLPNKKTFLNNFNHCLNWEDKYSYIIELGTYLSCAEEKIRQNKYLVPGCQSQTWIAIKINSINIETIKFYGDSDSTIVKGIISIIFIIYQDISLNSIITFDPHPILHQLQIIKNLTYSRSQGIESILFIIRKQAKKILQKLNL